MHIERIVKAYQAFKDEPGFARVATLDDVGAKDGKGGCSPPRIFSTSAIVLL